jgi:hypothetical protein
MQPPNGVRYWRWGGVDSALEQKKLKARQMLENAPDSPSVQCTRCWALFTLGTFIFCFSYISSFRLLLFVSLALFTNSRYLDF